MIKYAAKITAINPSAARFAHEEMLRLVLVGISTLCNVFAAGIFIRLSLASAGPNAYLMR